MKTWKQLEPTLTAATLLLAVAGAIPLAAQTSPTTPTTAATCTTAPTGLTTLNFERAATLSDILTTLTPNLAANVLASIAGGAQEIREIFIYNPQQGTVTSTVFLVASGAPLPTPNFNFQTGVIQTTTTKISLILAGCNPVPSLLLVGTASASSASGAFGNVNGSPVAISIGYTTDTPPKINNVAEVIAGIVVAYSAAGTGTVTFPVVPVVPPGSTGGVTVTVTSPQLGTLMGGAKVIQTSQNPTLLDASGSTGGASTDALTYSWSTLGSPVNFTGTGKTGQIEVTFPSPGDYTIQLTVTDTSTGTSAMYSVILEYNGTR
jgi:hypothetical protein